MKEYTGQSIVANYFKGIEAVGGKLFFDETGMTFKSHALNIQSGETRIQYDQISRISKRNTLGIVPNGMSVFTANGFEHKFVINHREDIIAFLVSKLQTEKE